MQVVILAGDTDADGQPRALTEVAGRALIDYALAFAAAVGADHRIAVGGHGYAALARRLGTRDPDVVVVDGEPDGGELLAFLSGRGRLEPGGFLLLHAGWIYQPSLAPRVARVAAAADQIIVFCHRDRDRTDRRVRMGGDGVVAEVGRALEPWDMGYAGMTFVPASRVSSHGDAARRALAELGESAPVEAALRQLAADGAPAVMVDIGDQRWLDVGRSDPADEAAGVLFSRKWWT